MTGSHIKGLLLDLDNTLVDTKGADVNAYSKVEHYLSTNCKNCDPKAVIKHFQKLLKEKEIDPDGIKSADDWRTSLWQTALSDNACQKTSSEIYQLWKDTRIEGIFFTEEVQSLLKQLRSEYKLLLLTNGDSVIQRAKIKQCRAEEYFESIVISGDEPHPKPHPSIFEKSFKMLSVFPDECVMIGDSLATDIQGGINSNCRATVFVNPGGQPPVNSTCPKPHYTIESILELPRILDEIADKH
ncbi:N-acylneuraminate-9-phosphatase-like [Anneissia japonica]|uniref:N-acylneuraminate-9-phosphatase-like n=1 Tax=Anneissia japonica TaxID=1529436 RepID=UPI0014256D4C|nr:N-acylneuraminate-9-phosphatase-like [Anneissia japonica]